MSTFTSTFTILGSNSSGNSALLITEQCRVLIDAGFSGKRTCELLEEMGLKAEDLDAVFLTHEHGDHACGVRGLARYKNLRFFANRQTATAIQRPITNPVKWSLFETGTTFSFCDLRICPVAVPHDASEPVGFIFEFGEDTLFSSQRSLAWITDLGYITNSLSHRLQHVDHLVVEANHDEELVQQDNKRPWSVKQRVLGRHGHLSNRAIRQWMDSVERPRWKSVDLVHLSRDCNSIELIHDQIVTPMSARGINNIRIHNPCETRPVVYSL
jgi:phosphoribosyl 1,2-cyclic phosphodiesterase